MRGVTLDDVASRLGRVLERRERRIVTRWLEIPEFREHSRIPGLRTTGDLHRILKEIQSEG